VTPHQRDEVFHLGLPGVGLIAENKRVYPNGPIGAHVLGFANVDNIASPAWRNSSTGRARRSSRRRLQHDAEELSPITLSLDIKATHALRDELAKASSTSSAGGAAAIMDVNTGESSRWLRCRLRPNSRRIFTTSI